MSYHKKPETIAKERAAQSRWHQKNTEYFSIGLRKGARARYRLLAKHRGVSLSSIIKEKLDEECRKEFGEMLKTFIFEELEGYILIENSTPNKYGNITVKFVWGEIEEYPTFRSLDDIDKFLKNSDDLANFIDQATHY